VVERQLKFVLSGEDRSASSTLGKAANTAESASSKIGGAFSRVGGQIGGEFGEVLNRVGEGLDKLGEHGQSMGKKLAVGGAAVMGVGLLLTAAGSKEKQATDQLKAAIDATGASYSDYSDKIEKTVKHEENYAHSAVDTKTALQTLTTATGDTKKALDQMQVVTDLAAAKHESLSEAAGQVAKVLGGSGGKLLIQYGIHMKTNADGTKDAAGARDQLGQKLKGQASASMDNFGAKVDEVKTKIGDWTGEMGQKFGPALTVAGAAIEGVAAGMEILGARAARAAAAEATLAASETTQGAGAVAAAGGTSLLSRALGSMSVAEGAAAKAGIGLLGGLGLIAVAAGAAVGAAAELSAAHSRDHGLAKQLSADYKDFAGSADQSAAAQARWALAGKSSNSALQGATLDTAHAVEKLGVSQNDLIAGVLGTDTAYQSLVSTIKTKGGVDKAQLSMLGDLHAAFGAQDQAVAGAATSTTKLGDAAKAAAAKQKMLRSELVDVTTKAFGTAAQLGNLNNALDRLSNNSIDATQQELHLRDALASASQTLKGNGSAINDNTVKGRANKEWLLEQVSAINSHVSSVGKQTGSVQKATVALSSDTAQLRAAASAAGLNKAQVDALIRSYAATPRKIQTEIAADTAAAKKKIKDLQAQINALQGKALQIQINENISVNRGENAAGQIGIKHAGGGYLSEGWNTAGEGTATELMYKQGSSVQVLTNQQSAPMLAGAGPTHIHINLPGLYGGAEAGRVVAGILEKYVAAGGSITVGRGIR
jgi:hypothetical protein